MEGAESGELSGVPQASCSLEKFFVTEGTETDTEGTEEGRRFGLCALGLKLRALCDDGLGVEEEG